MLFRSELQVELHRRNHWHPGHGAMEDTCPAPCMGKGHGIATTGSAPTDQVIVRPDDAATRSGEAFPIPGLVVPRPWGTLEVRHRARSCFPEPGPRGRGPGTEQCSRVPVDQGSSQSHDLPRAWEPPAKAQTGWMTTQAGVCESRTFPVFPPTPDSMRTKGDSWANGPSRAASADAQRP